MKRSFTCVAIAVVTVVWLAAGFSLAFGPDLGLGLLGGFDHLGMHGIGPTSRTGHVPTLLFATFQRSEERRVGKECRL